VFDSVIFCSIHLFHSISHYIPFTYRGHYGPTIPIPDDSLLISILHCLYSLTLQSMMIPFYMPQPPPTIHSILLFHFHFSTILPPIIHCIHDTVTVTVLTPICFIYHFCRLLFLPTLFISVRGRAIPMFLYISTVEGVEETVPHSAYPFCSIPLFILPRLVFLPWDSTIRTLHFDSLPCGNSICSTAIPFVLFVLPFVGAILPLTTTDLFPHSIHTFFCYSIHSIFIRVIYSTFILDWPFVIPTFYPFGIHLTLIRCLFDSIHFILLTIRHWRHSDIPYPFHSTTLMIVHYDYHTFCISTTTTVNSCSRPYISTGDCSPFITFISCSHFIRYSVDTYYTVLTVRGPIPFYHTVLHFVLLTISGDSCTIRHHHLLLLF